MAQHRRRVGDRVEIGADAGRQNVAVARAAGVQRAVDLDADFDQHIGALVPAFLDLARRGDILHVQFIDPRRHADRLADRAEGGVERAVGLGLSHDLAVAMAQRDPRHRPAPVAGGAHDFDAVEVPQGGRLARLAQSAAEPTTLGDDRAQPRRVDDPDPVRDQLELLEHRVKIGPRQVEPQGRRLGDDRRAPAMLAQHDAVGGEADVGRVHDFIGFAVGEEAVLVDAAFMGEGVDPDDRLVARRRGVGHFAQDAAGLEQLGGVDVGGDPEQVGAGLERHHHFLERAIAGAFADAVDRAFDLPRPAAHRRQRIGDRHAEVVVAMGRQYRPVRRDFTRQERKQVENLLGRGVADRVGHVERRRPGIVRRAQRRQQIIALGADRVFGRKFDVVGKFARQPDGDVDPFENLVLAHLELGLAVERAGGDEHVDPAALRRRYCIPRRTDIAVAGACQRTDCRTLDALGNAADRRDLARPGRRKPRLDHVDLERRQRLGHPQLGVGAHREARRLLAIAQRRVENPHPVVGQVGRSQAGGGRSGRFDHRLILRHLKQKKPRSGRERGRLACNW